jgi:hypothetical protein
MKETQPQQPSDHSPQPSQEPRRKPFEAPALRWEERLTKMTAEQSFFGAES